MTMLTHLAFRPQLAALTTQAARIVELASLGSKVIRFFLHLPHNYAISERVRLRRLAFRNLSIVGI